MYGLQGNWDFAGSYSGILFGLILSYDIDNVVCFDEFSNCVYDEIWGPVFFFGWVSLFWWIHRTMGSSFLCFFLKFFFLKKIVIMRNISVVWKFEVMLFNKSPYNLYKTCRGINCPLSLFDWFWSWIQLRWVDHKWRLCSLLTSWKFFEERGKMFNTLDMIQCWVWDASCATSGD